MKVHLARILLEAQTPFTISSGESDAESDILLLKDANGLPYIPGTSLTGYMRSLLTSEEANQLFGPESTSEDQEASRVFVSDAYLLDEEEKPMDGLRPQLSSFVKNLSMGTIRDRVRIDGETGTALDKGKFQMSVALQGSRFLCELETDYREADNFPIDIWEKFLNMFLTREHRLGASKSTGLGAFRVLEIQKKTYNLKEKSDFEQFLNRPISLTEPLADADKVTPDQTSIPSPFSLELKPKSTWIFGSTLNDPHAD
ncbi:MAG: hypothetical protein D6767_10915, partial [Candidatus Hydrogenedentota bacterium]